MLLVANVVAMRAVAGNCTWTHPLTARNLLSFREGPRNLSVRGTLTCELAIVDHKF